MPSSVKADLLDDGIVDTLTSVGATRLDNAASGFNGFAQVDSLAPVGIYREARQCRRYGHINAVALCALS